MQNGAKRIEEAPKCCLCPNEAHHQYRDAAGQIVYRKIPYRMAAAMGGHRGYMCIKCHKRYLNNLHILSDEYMLRYMTSQLYVCQRPNLVDFLNLQ